jgi:hypothetical protein
LWPSLLCRRILFNSRAVKVKFPGDLFSSLLTRCGSFQPLRYFALWNFCIKATCSCGMCCDKGFCNSLVLDRLGTATSRVGLEG